MVNTEGRNLRIAIWAALIVAHIVIIVLVVRRDLDFLFNDGMHRGGPGTDWNAYLIAGRNWLTNAGMYNVDYAFGYRYHPLFAIGVVVPSGAPTTRTSSADAMRSASSSPARRSRARVGSRKCSS